MLSNERKKIIMECIEKISEKYFTKTPMDILLPITNIMRDLEIKAMYVDDKDKWERLSLVNKNCRFVLSTINGEKILLVNKYKYYKCKSPENDVYNANLDRMNMCRAMGFLYLYNFNKNFAYQDDINTEIGMELEFFAGHLIFNKRVFDNVCELAKLLNTVDLNKFIAGSIVLDQEIVDKIVDEYNNGLL